MAKRKKRRGRQGVTHQSRAKGTDRPSGPAQNVGRPSKFTDEVKSRIINLIEEGNYRKTAALAAGVSQSLFHEWLARGHRGDPGFLEFLESVEAAEATSEVVLTRSVWDGRVDPKVALDMLARRWPTRWGRTRVEVTGADNGPLQVQTANDESELRALPTESLERLMFLAQEAESIRAQADTIPAPPAGAEDG